MRSRTGARASRPAPEPAAGKLHLDRMRRVTGLCVLGFLVVCIRLAFLHLYPNQNLSDEDLKHIGRTEIVEPRGTIYDRQAVPLAMDQRVPSIWVDPRNVENPPHAALMLSLALGLDEDAVKAEMERFDGSGRERRFRYIKRFIPDLDREAVEALLEACGQGVHVMYEPMRYYPQYDTAAHVLGFVTRYGDALRGIELTQDALLRSAPGSRSQRVDGKRNFLASTTMDYTPPEGGNNVQLTIDVNIQHVLERELDAAIERNHAVGAMGIVIDPHSGAILALANRPAFDLNAPGAPEARQRMLNQAVEGAFEPGSVLKIVPAAAALELGFVTADTIIDCEGGSFRPYGRRVIRDVRKMGRVSFTETYAHSSNVASIKVGAQLGPERMEEWLLRFGFGQPTGIELPDESAGLFQRRAQWNRDTMVVLPMGQGIATTMPQLARAFGVIANGGYLVDPYLVERAMDRDGREIYRREAPRPLQALSPETVRVMKELSFAVVNGGTGRHAVIPEYRAGGKTGTAQIARADGRGYRDGVYNAVFAGFAPLTHPRLVAVIVVQEPGIPRGYGGVVSGPVFREVVRTALASMGVPEERMPDHAPDERMRFARNAEADLPEEDPDTVNPWIVEDAPPMEPALRNEDLINLAFVEPTLAGAADEGPALPDLSGLTKAQARERLVQLGVPWDPRGTGRVIAQFPPPGTPLRQVSLCRVEFARSSIELEEDAHAVEAAL